MKDASLFWTTIIMQLVYELRNQTWILKIGARGEKTKLTSKFYSYNISKLFASLSQSYGSRFKPCTSLTFYLLLLNFINTVGGATVIDFEIFIPWQLSDFRILLFLKILQLRCPIPPETKFEFMKILNWLKRKGGW